MTTPTIAVLMPVYNPGSDLAKTLDSLRRQSEPFHLFLVDDGSPRKPDYAAALAGISHTLIALPRNLGITGALNAGLAAILAGPWTLIARLDNGDLATPNRLAAQRRFCEAHPEIDIVGSFADVFFEDTGASHREAPPCDHLSIARKLRYNTVISHPSMMIRADLFRRIGPYSAEFDATEDYELCRRADAAGAHFAVIPEALLIKIENSNSISWKKRDIQLRNRLRIQLRYLGSAGLHGIPGAIRTALQIATPKGLVERLKARIKPRAGKAALSGSPRKG
jgi:GT2 family glycosyltransferase